MGWTGGGEILHDVWPTVFRFVEPNYARKNIYTALVQALEEQDADTLGEVIDCHPTANVDPMLVSVLIDRGHYWGQEDEE